MADFTEALARHSLLVIFLYVLVTERGDQRPGGAGSQAKRRDPCEAAGGRLPGVETPRLSGGAAAGDHG
jgi:hypothetical protein